MGRILHDDAQSFKRKGDGGRVHPWFWAPRSAQKRHLEALFDRFLPDPSADARTPQNGVLFAHFAPRSLQTGRRDRETKARDPLTQSDRFRNVRWITRPPQGARSVGIALSWCRWTPTTALPMALLAQSRGPKSGKYQKNVQDGR